MLQLDTVVGTSLTCSAAYNGDHEKTITSWSDGVAKSVSTSHVASPPIPGLLSVKSMIDRHFFPCLVGWSLLLMISPCFSMRCSVVPALHRLSVHGSQAGLRALKSPAKMVRPSTSCDKSIRSIA